jgi:hypothetical protein
LQAQARQHDQLQPLNNRLHVTEAFR